MTFGTRETFVYDLCGDCGTLQIRDIPGDLSRHYPDDYYSFEPPPRPRTWRGRMLARARDRHAVTGRGVFGTWASKRLPPHRVLSTLRGLDLTPATRLLDVGSGSGAYLRDLGDLGFRNVLGADPHLPRDVVHDNGVRVLARPLEEVEGTFDVITFHHAFEHVADPRATLRAAADRLAEDGTILLRVPTVSSQAFETYGADWVQLDAPRHLHLLSRDAVARLAAGAGLVLTHMEDDSTAFQFWGSEQLRDDVAVLDATSYAVDPRASRFAPDDIARMERDAAALNARRQGDQSCFRLHRA